MDRTLTRRRVARLRRKTAGRSGAAMVEAVIVLSVFAPLLLGALYLPRLYGTGLSALALARRCAVGHAMGGCDAHSIPAVCSGLIESHMGASHESEPLLRAGGSALHHLPVLVDTLDGLFGTSTWAAAHSTLDGPLPEGVEEARVAAAFHLLCNTAPTSASASQVATDLFEEWVPL